MLLLDLHCGKAPAPPLAFAVEGLPSPKGPADESVVVQRAGRKIEPHALDPTTHVRSPVEVHSSPVREQLIVKIVPVRRDHHRTTNIFQDPEQSVMVALVESSWVDAAGATSPFWIGRIRIQQFISLEPIPAKKVACVRGEKPIARRKANEFAYNVWVEVDSDVFLGRQFVSEDSTTAQMGFDVNPMARHKADQLLIAPKFASRVTHMTLRVIVSSDDDVKGTAKW